MAVVVVNGFLVCIIQVKFYFNRLPIFHSSPFNTINSHKIISLIQVLSFPVEMIDICNLTSFIIAYIFISNLVQLRFAPVTASIL